MPFMKYIRKIFKVTALILCLSTAVVTTGRSYAVTVSEAQREKKELEAKKAETKELLSDLESDKEDILAYVNKLDKKMTALSSGINDIEKKIKKKEKNIQKLEIKIENAQTDISNQYDTMKKRIKYMYENKNSGYIDILLSSGGLADFLNRSEYIEKISEYDSEMITNYKKAKDDLELKRQELTENREILVESKKELENEKNALDTILEKKNSEIAKFNQDIKAAESEISDYNSELEKQERIIEEALLEEQRRIIAEEARKKAEEERRRAEEAKKNQSAGVHTPTSAPSVQPSAGGYIWPLAISGTITSRFGYRTSPTAGASSYHQGIDVSAPAGTSIRATRAGTVTTASYSSGAGNYVMLNHGDGVFSIYMHCSSLNVKKGQSVTAGATIAYVGSTGVSTGNHLHFGISVGGKYVDPLGYVSR